MWNDGACLAARRPLNGVAFDRRDDDGWASAVVRGWIRACLGKLPVEAYRLMPACTRAAIAIPVVCILRLHGGAASLAAEAPDAGASVQADADASPSTGAGTSTRGNGPPGPSLAVEKVCLSRYLHRRSGYPEAVPSLEQAKWISAQCQKCPDAWSKCEPCADVTVLKTALDIGGYLLFTGDKGRANAVAAEKQIASAIHDGHPDVADQLRRKQEDALALAKSQYQEAVDYYLAALRVPNQPLRDEVLVGLADLYFFDLDHVDMAAEHYHKLNGKKVDPGIVTHAMLMLGQIHLTNGERLAAETEFRKASKVGTGAMALCGTYKQAWTLALLGHARLAQNAFRTCARADRRDRLAAFISRTCAVDGGLLYP